MKDWELTHSKDLGLTIGSVAMVVYWFAAILAHANGCPLTWWAHGLVGMSGFIWGPLVIALLFRLNKTLNLIFGGQKYAKLMYFIVKKVGGAKLDD